MLLISLLSWPLMEQNCPQRRAGRRVSPAISCVVPVTCWGSSAWARSSLSVDNVVNRRPRWNPGRWGHHQLLGLRSSLHAARVFKMFIMAVTASHKSSQQFFIVIANCWLWPPSAIHVLWSYQPLNRFPCRARLRRYRKAVEQMILFPPWVHWYPSNKERETESAGSVCELHTAFHFLIITQPWFSFWLLLILRPENATKSIKLPPSPMNPYQKFTLCQHSTKCSEKSRSLSLK